MHKTRSSESETSGSYIHDNRFFSRGRSLLSYPDTASDVMFLLTDAMFSSLSAPDLSTEQAARLHLTELRCQYLL